MSVLNCPSDNGDPYEAEYSPHYGVKPGSGFQGAKTSYDFCVSLNTTCNYWSRQDPSTRRMFGENSSCQIAAVHDGTSNTIAMAETTYTVWNGSCPAWGYRGWVMPGVDPAGGINVWAWPGVMTTPPVPGQLCNWGQMGSLHPGGAHAVLAAGSVQWLSETTDTVILERLSAMADGEVVAIP